LVDFAVHAGPFIDADIKVAAASVDSIEQTVELKAGLRVGFPMYAELDAGAVAEATGAFMQSGERTFLHATGFVLRPDGTIANACYATGPIGRYNPTEILRSVLFARSQS
jgi:alkyl hydroperoxide reductase subunit AhpC